MPTDDAFSDVFCSRQDGRSQHRISLGQARSPHSAQRQGARDSCMAKNCFGLHTVLLNLSGNLRRMHISMLGTCFGPCLEGTFRYPVTFWCNLRKMKTIKISPSAKSYRQLEDVVGCKWSVSVLQAIGAGISRPGALERHIPGISTKVLSERLRKLTGYGLLDKHVHAEVPPRTEYLLTENGKKLVGIIDQIKLLDDEIGSAEQDTQTDARTRRR